MELVGLTSGVAGTVVALITLTLVLLRGALTSERRITALETKVDLFWDAARGIVAGALQGKAPENPINEARWAYLLDKFRSNQLTLAEANELQIGFLETERKAKEDKDLATLLAIGLGLALLAVLIGERNRLDELCNMFEYNTGIMNKAQCTAYGDGNARMADLG